MEIDGFLPAVEVRLTRKGPTVASHTPHPGRAELRAAGAGHAVRIGSVVVFSLCVNLLMLAGPLYMLNVHDRVLGSRSVETLITLSAIMAWLYACMAVLDAVRSRVMGRVGADVRARLELRVFDASLRAVMLDRAAPQAASASRDLDAVHRVWTTLGFLALFDLPFVPIFFAGLLLFHPMLGALGLGGAVLLLILAILNLQANHRSLHAAAEASTAAHSLETQIRQQAETISALGMRRAAFARWQQRRQVALAAFTRAADRGSTYAAITRSTRLALQSAMLGLGAYLVLQGEVSAGAMVASSIILGRAVAPIETIVSGWSGLVGAWTSRRSLALLLATIPSEPPRTTLPRPRGRLTVDQLTLVPPGARQATLRMLSFAVAPGQVLGVIGSSGSGKSTLARALVGHWAPSGGTIRLDGATLDQFGGDALGPLVGYLPQRVVLFEGTVRDNIARLSPRADDADVIRAAQLAAAHEMILALPDGYDTQVHADGGRLSGGQIQRIGLARALYGDPVLVILDEPNASLDNEGNIALNAAIRALKGQDATVIIMAHRPSALQECDLLMHIEDGVRRAFGPKDEVLRSTIASHPDLRGSGAASGVLREVGR